jgi:hypothetical protein
MIHHPSDPVPEQHNVKVDEKTDLNVQQTQVRQKLSLVYRVQGFLAFDFYDDAILHNQISSETAFQLDGFVGQWDRLLPLHPKTDPFKLVRQTCFVCRFQKARTKLAMDFYGAPIISGVRSRLRIPESLKPLTAECAK